MVRASPNLTERGLGKADDFSPVHAPAWGSLGRSVLGGHQQGISALRAIAFSAEAERHSSHTHRVDARQHHRQHFAHVTDDDPQPRMSI
jgi:hypothetical protein